MYIMGDPKRNGHDYTMPRTEQTNGNPFGALRPGLLPDRDAAISIMGRGSPPLGGRLWFATLLPKDRPVS